ncbi:MAG: gamma carbonic anhydrase family protein [Kordiimonadaceae bacterium]|jgi:gamma-carbonic anhydrase|nr:gamma carbonic anhydrase family protein [Kordiimonadaceae bacterium]
MSEFERIANGGGKLYPYNGIWPKIADDCFIAPGARIIGDVVIGAGSSIWFNCVLRGDVGKIRIGKNTNIQDGSVIHVDSGGFDTTLGDNVLVGHMVMIHGSTIEDYGFVGLNATTMDGSYIEKNGMLAAGSLLSPGKRIGTQELWMGRPARFSKNIDDEMKTKLEKVPKGYSILAQEYLKEHS